MSRRVAGIDLEIVVVPPRSRWAFVRVRTTDGLCGIGEATLNRNDDVLAAWAGEARRQLVGLDLDQLGVALRGFGAAVGGLAGRAIASAIDQARWDLLGKVLGAPLHALLGREDPAPVALYANLNRGLTGRSAADFAAAARAAVAEGMRAVKCAPFDGLLPGRLTGGARALFEAGLARVAAVRDAIGADVDLLVDCHWRFDARGARTAVRELGAFSPFWIEAPVAETDPRSWRPARRAMDCLLAGGEMLQTPRSFHEFMTASGADVVMPDVKYCGGVSGLMKVAAIADALAVRVAPHNPSGPVASLATAHAVQAMDGFLVLEFPWGEWSDRTALVGGAERVQGGELHLGPVPGIGATLDLAAAPASASVATTPTVEDTLL